MINLKNTFFSRVPCSAAQSSHSRSSSRSSLDEALPSQPRSKDSSALSTTAGSAKTKPLLDYSVYMASVLPKQEAFSPTAASPALQSPQSSPGADKKVVFTYLSCTTFSCLIPFLRWHTSSHSVLLHSLCYWQHN